MATWPSLRGGKPPALRHRTHSDRYRAVRWKDPHPAVDIRLRRPYMQLIAQLIANMVVGMAVKNFRDEHALKGAFLSNKLLRLVDLIALQGDELLRDAEITIPSRAVACTLFIGDKGQVSLADIAEALDEPHQLSAQRVEGLIQLGLLERRDDPNDRRRKVLSLTRRGKAQYQLLLVRLAEIEQAFIDLYTEIKADLPTILENAIGALQRTPLLERIRKNAVDARELNRKKKAT